MIHLRYKERTLLLPGDAEKQVEYTLLNEEHSAGLQADVLKVGHHGSKNSTTPEFLQAVAPRIAVISVGEENLYGHPTAELLTRARERRCAGYRTDQQGAVQNLDRRAQPAGEMLRFMRAAA